MGLTGLTDEQLGKIHGDCDANSDGELSFDEFSKSIAMYYDKDGAGADGAARIW